MDQLEDFREGNKHCHYNFRKRFDGADWSRYYHRLEFWGTIGAISLPIAGFIYLLQQTSLSRGAMLLAAFLMITLTYLSVLIISRWWNLQARKRLAEIQTKNVWQEVVKRNLEYHVHITPERFSVRSETEEYHELCWHDLMCMVLQKENCVVVTRSFIYVFPNSSLPLAPEKFAEQVNDWAHKWCEKKSA